MIGTYLIMILERNGGNTPREVKSRDAIKGSCSIYMNSQERAPSEQRRYARHPVASDELPFVLFILELGSCRSSTLIVVLIETAFLRALRELEYCIEEMRQVALASTTPCTVQTNCCIGIR